jgi:hypothetical protein
MLEEICVARSNSRARSSTIKKLQGSQSPVYQLYGPSMDSEGSCQKDIDPTGWLAPHHVYLRARCVLQII